MVTLEEEPGGRWIHLQGALFGIMVAWLYGNLFIFIWGGEKWKGGREIMTLPPPEPAPGSVVQIWYSN